VNVEQKAKLTASNLKNLGLGGPAERAETEVGLKSTTGIDLDEKTLESALAEAPHASIDQTGATVTDLMAECGIAASKSVARRLIEEGGAYLNNDKVTDVNAVPAAGDLLHGRFLVLRRGKREVGGIEVRR